MSKLLYSIKKKNVFKLYITRKMDFPVIYTNCAIFSKYCEHGVMSKHWFYRSAIRRFRGWAAPTDCNIEWWYSVSLWYLTIDEFDYLCMLVLFICLVGEIPENIFSDFSFSKKITVPDHRPSWKHRHRTEFLTKKAAAPFSWRKPPSAANISG